MAADPGTRPGGARRCRLRPGRDRSPTSAPARPRPRRAPRRTAPRPCGRGPAGVDGADVAHVFSALALADRPLTAYDLERLSTAPGWCCCPLASPAPATCWPATR